MSSKNLSQPVKEFVKDLNGRYKSHVSDEFLEHLLVNLIITEHDSLKRRQSLEISVYNAGCTVFESILEHQCRTGGNGHHVAQDLAKKFAQ